MKLLLVLGMVAVFGGTIPLRAQSEVSDAPANAPARVLYVGPARPDGQVGKGTQEDPLDGGTSARFQSILSTVPSDSVIQLLPGNYTVVSRPETKWKCAVLRGSGMYATTLTLGVQTTADYLTPFYPGADPYDHLVVSDLTVDMQAGSQPRGSVMSCGINVRHGGFERVRVLRWGNPPASLGDGTPAHPNLCREAFGLVVGPTDGSKPSDVFIRDCVVEPALPDMIGGGNTSLSVNSFLTGPADSIPTSAMITGNVVNARPGDMGIAAAGFCKGIIIRGNHVRDAGRAIHQDTSFTDASGTPHASLNMLVDGNFFENCWPILGLGSGGGGGLVDGCQFSNNQCTVGRNSYAQYGGGAAFWLDKNVTGFTATNNRITLEPGVTIPPQDGRVLFQLNGDNGLVTFSGNIVADRLCQHSAALTADTPGTPHPTIIHAWHNSTLSGDGLDAPFADQDDATATGK